MTFLLALISNLGALIAKLAPFFFAYRAGKVEAEHDFQKTINEILEEDNEELRHITAMPDHAIADKLRERAAQKRKD